MRVSKIQRSNIIARLRDSGSVFAEDEAEMLISASRTLRELSDRVDRRAAGRPLEHVLGWAEFCGLRIAVDPGVFVPRRRTEFLVRQAVAAAESGGALVVDLCCGSGAVGVAVLAALGRGELYAVDIDPAAVRCARRNVAARGRVFQGDLYDPLPRALQGRVGLLTANAPYVPTEAMERMPREARLYEPAAALDGGGDGLDAQRRVIADAPLWLAPGGRLILETSRRQAMKTAEMCRNVGLVSRVVHSDDLDATVVIGTSPALN